MAYLEDCTKRCTHCKQLASKQLFTRFDTALGFYCARCAPGALKEQERKERAYGRTFTEDSGRVEGEYQEALLAGMNALISGKKTDGNQAATQSSGINRGSEAP